MSGIRDAQEHPGGGTDQSAAGSPPAGAQRSVREYAREAGGSPTTDAPADSSHNVLDYRG